MINPEFLISQTWLINFPTVYATGDFARDAQILATDLDRLALSLRSFREPFNRSIRQVIIPSIRRNFDEEGRPVQWRQLTLSWALQRGSAHPILNYKGKLKRVATQVNIWRVGSTSAEIVGLDTRVKYAKYHQAGTRFMPQREFILYQEEDLDNIERIFYEWMVERTVRQGRFSP